MCQKYRKNNDRLPISYDCNASIYRKAIELPTISGKVRVCHLPHNLLPYDPDLKRRILKPNLKWDSCMLKSVVLVDMIRT